MFKIVVTSCLILTSIIGASEVTKSKDTFLRHAPADSEIFVSSVNLQKGINNFLKSQLGSKVLKLTGKTDNKMEDFNETGLVLGKGTSILLKFLTNSVERVLDSGIDAWLQSSSIDNVKNRVASKLVETTSDEKNKIVLRSIPNITVFSKLDADKNSQLMAVANAFATIAKKYMNNEGILFSKFEIKGDGIVLQVELPKILAEIKNKYKDDEFVNFFSAILNDLDSKMLTLRLYKKDNYLVFSLGQQSGSTLVQDGKKSLADVTKLQQDYQKIVSNDTVGICYTSTIICKMLKEFSPPYRQNLAALSNDMLELLPSSTQEKKELVDYLKNLAKVERKELKQLSEKITQPAFFTFDIGEKSMKIKSLTTADEPNNFIKSFYSLKNTDQSNLEPFLWTHRVIGKEKQPTHSVVLGRIEKILALSKSAFLADSSFAGMKQVISHIDTNVIARLLTANSKPVDEYSLAVTTQSKITGGDNSGTSTVSLTRPDVSLVEHYSNEKKYRAHNQEYMKTALKLFDMLAKILPGSSITSVKQDLRNALDITSKEALGNGKSVYSTSPKITKYLFNLKTRQEKGVKLKHFTFINLQLLVREAKLWGKKLNLNNNKYTFITNMTEKFSSVVLPLLEPLKSILIYSSIEEVGNGKRLMNEYKLSF